MKTEITYLLSTRKTKSIKYKTIKPWKSYYVLGPDSTIEDKGDFLIVENYTLVTRKLFNQGKVNTKDTYNAVKMDGRFWLEKKDFDLESGKIILDIE